jgi:hypothetical protein
MLLARREPDHIPWADLFDGAAPALRLATAGRDDQDLAQWMGMPLLH